MAYSDFTLPLLVERFALTLDERRDLFPDVAPLAPSETLRAALALQLPLVTAINTEKARSEPIIIPVLMEVYRVLQGEMSLFSGTDFTVDRALGLIGVCDFIVSRSVENLYVKHPIMIIFEAKNENFVAGYPQCGAAMLAAQRFHLQAGHESDAMYGAVTTGTAWRFLRLRGTHLTIDATEYYINDVGKIVAIIAAVVAGTLDMALPV